MKKAFFLFLLFLAGSLALAQVIPENILSKYKSAKNEHEKIIVLSEYFISLQQHDNNISRKLVEVQDYFINRGDEFGADLMKIITCNTLTFKKDHAAALKISIPLSHKLEERGDTALLMSVYESIAASYNASGNALDAIPYFHKKIPLCQAAGDKLGLINLYNNIGSSYADATTADSGLAYA